MGSALIGLLAGLLYVTTGSARSLGNDPPTAHAARNLVDLGERYENGESVSRNYVRARLLYCEAAAEGDPSALLALAWLLMNGRGVARDDQAAAFWLRKAAAAHVPQAAALLSALGNVTPVNRGCAVPGRGSGNASVVPQGFPVPREAIAQAATDAGIQPSLLSSIVSVESGYDATAISPKGAAGLMQLMPATADRFHVQNVFDYRENLRGGAAYIRILLDKFGGDLTLALAAYNAGEAAVDTYHGVPPYPETLSYIATVTRLCGCGGVPAASPAMLVRSATAAP